MNNFQIISIANATGYATCCMAQSARPLQTLVSFATTSALLSNAISKSDIRNGSMLFKPSTLSCAPNEHPVILYTIH